MRINTVTLVSLAMVAALGLVVRMFVRIPLIPGLVELTPGFMFSELGGVMAGIPGGLLVGAIVGFGGAMAANEPPLLLMIGNIALGVGTGIALHIEPDRNRLRYIVMVILGGGIIGGLLPSMTIFAPLTESFAITLSYAMLDMYQGFVWGAAALLVEAFLLRPMLARYMYAEEKELLLDEDEG